jgi:hypothetical protein
VALDAHDLLAEAEGDADVAEVVLQPLGDLGVAELERCSTTVTFVPSAANIEAYSMPITPAPTTTIARGTCGSCSTPSESSTVTSSNSTDFGRFGRVPVATMMFCAVTRRSSPTEVAETVCASTKCASPWSSATPLRASWFLTTSISRWITACVRQKRSSVVICSLTR